MFFRALKKAFSIFLIWTGLDIVIANASVHYHFLSSLIPGAYRYTEGRFKILKRDGVTYRVYLRDMVYWLFFTHKDTCGDDAFFSLDIPKKEPLMIFDIGANFGRFTLGLAQKLSARGLRHTIYAFEPNPSVYEKLRFNLALNPKLAESVITSTLGIGEKNEILEIQAPNRNTGAGSLIENYGEEPSHTYPVHVVPLDDFFDEQKLDSVDFIKIDVECYEPYVLKGAEKVIRTYHPTIYIEVVESCALRTCLKSDFIHAFLRDCGYSFYREEDNGAWVNIPYPGNVFEKPQYNMLAIHESKNTHVKALRKD